MKLYEIKPLFYDMGCNKVKQDKFSFKYNKVKFDVIVLIDREPFELLFGGIDENYFFALKLFKGYELENLSDEAFYKLCDILKLKPSKEHFNSHKFLKHFANNIPQEYSRIKIEPDEIAVHKKHFIDENEKIYFKGWRPHTTDGRTVRNLEKTKELLGDEAYQYCKEHNISSCWSAQRAERKSYYPPNEFKIT